MRVFGNLKLFDVLFAGDLGFSEVTSHSNMSLFGRNVFSTNLVGESKRNEYSLTVAIT